MDKSSSTSSNAVIYYYVTLSAPAPSNMLLPAMTARLDIIVGEVKNALCVPIAALKTDNQGSYVEIAIKKGALLDGDEVSVSYEAEAKKAAMPQNMPRRMPPM